MFYRKGLGMEATRPGREDIAALFAQGDLVPVYRRLLVDLETPVSIYLKLRQRYPRAFILESVQGAERVGRYSFIGVETQLLIRVQGREVTWERPEGWERRRLAEGEDPLHVVQAELARFRPVVLPGLPRLVGGLVGYLGYECVRFFERLPETTVAELDVPDAVFMMPATLAIFDHVRHELLILSNARLEETAAMLAGAESAGDAAGGDAAALAAYDAARARVDAVEAIIRAPLPPLAAGAALHSAPLNEPFRSNMTQERYEAMVRRAREYIHDGDIFQVVLSQRFSTRTSASAMMLYRALRALNPSPYMFMLDFGADLRLIGASPEMMVRLEDGIATVRPIAGTRWRGRDAAEDEALAVELLADEKERAEHVMLVDLGRNDLGRVCEYGSVAVKEQMVVERYSHVMHIVSHVEGKIRPGLNAFDLLRATFPAGTLSGAPKVRAMEIIEELEGTQRGPYGGAVGYFSYDGSMDTCITIRTLLMQEARCTVQAGGGIVADSVPAREHRECVNKAQALAAAIRFAENGLREGGVE